MTLQLFPSSGTFNTTGGNTPTTTVAILNAMCVAVLAASGNTNTWSLTDNNADGLGTTPGWTQILQVFSRSSADKMAVFVRNANFGVAASTVFTPGPSGAGMTGSTGGGIADLYFVTGHQRIGPALIRAIAASNQIGTQTNVVAASTPAPVFPAVSLATNAIITAIMNATNPAGSTIPTGFSAGSNTGYGSPATGYHSAYHQSGSALTTVTWAATSATAFSSFCIELDASGPGGFFQLMKAKRWRYKNGIVVPRLWLPDPPRIVLPGPRPVLA